MKNYYEIKVKTRNNGIFRNFLSMFVFAIIVIILYNFFLIVISSDSNQKSYIFGFKAYIIETNSMEPELKAGDMIIVKKCETDSIKVGDIITFRRENEHITHRVVEINALTKSYSTKGDNNSISDVQDVSFEDIEGKKVIIFSKGGTIIRNLQNVVYITFIFIILITMFLHNIRLKRKHSLRRRKKKMEDIRRRESEILF